MDDQANRAAVERKWQACSYPANLDELEAVYDADAVVEWPQSGERVLGRENILELHRNYPGGAPTITPRRIAGSGEFWFSEQLGEYGGRIYFGSSMFEVRDGRIVRETSYFGEPFEPPAWRARWVERAGGADDVGAETG